MSDNVSKVAQLTADTTDRGLQQLEDGYRVRRSARSQIFAPVGIKAQASVSAKPATNQSTPLKAKLNKPKPSTRLKTKGLNPRHILISTGDTTSRNKPQNHDRLPEESFGSKQSHILTLKLSREKLVAILVRPTKVAVANAPCFGTAQPTIFSTIPAKRSLSSDNSVEDFGPLEFISPKKRQRRPTKLASNASPEETNPPAPSVESRPEPVGEPPAWSVVGISLVLCKHYSC